MEGVARHMALNPAYFSRMKNVSGQRFGRLTALWWVKIDGHRGVHWACLCDCGSSITVPSRALGIGNTRSCGCLRLDNVRAALAKRKAQNVHISEEKRFKNAWPRNRKLWTTTIFERDNYTCDLCGRRGGIWLHAHHLNCKAHYPEQSLDVDNGITLCREDHKRFHNSLGGIRVPCTREDYFKYKEKLQQEINMHADLTCTTPPSTATS